MDFHSHVVLEKRCPSSLLVEPKSVNCVSISGWVPKIHGCGPWESLKNQRSINFIDIQHPKKLHSTSRFTSNKSHPFTQKHLAGWKSPTEMDPSHLHRSRPAPFCLAQRRTCSVTFSCSSAAKSPQELQGNRPRKTTFQGGVHKWWYLNS